MAINGKAGKKMISLAAAVPLFMAVRDSGTKVD